MADNERQKTVRPSYQPPVLTDGRDAGSLMLRNGTRLKLSRALAEDAQQVRAFLDRLASAERNDVLRSLNLKRSGLTSFLQGMAGAESSAAFLVQGEDDEKVAAFAAYRLLEGMRDTACVGLAVAPRWRSMGIATLLLERVAVLAARQGVARIVGVSQADNQGLIGLFKASGYQPDVRQHEDAARFLINTRAWSAAAEDSVRRHSPSFVAASLRPLFHPRSVAVVGASRDPQSLGHRLVASLVNGGFNGPVYPINPRAEHIHSIRAFASVSEIGSEVDLAVLLVPAERILSAVDDCAAAGVQALVVITAYFSEVGPRGAERERQLTERVRQHGMRMLGPNCMGLIHNHPEIRLNASLATELPGAGTIALCSQSGALGVAVTALARRLGLGLSSFVSLGNRSDITGNDLLEYWEEDESTRVILFYLESFGNPRRFARLARRVGRSKPIVAVKGGRSQSARRGGRRHSGSHHTTNTAVEALFHQTGVIRADNLDEMFDVAKALASQPLPPGRRVAVVTNAGGPAILAADALEAAGLVLEPLSPDTVAALERILPHEAQTRNPVDMLAASDHRSYRHAVEILLAADEVDILIVIYTAVGMADTDEVSKAVATAVDAARSRGRAASKPVLASWVGENERVSMLHTGAGEQIPIYCFPETMGRLLGKIGRYAEWRRTDRGVFPEYRDQRLPSARRLCERILKQRGATFLDYDETRELLRSAGLEVLAGGSITTADDGVELADELGYPVALRLLCSDAGHRVERGAVFLDLKDPQALRSAVAAVQGSFAELLGAGAQLVVQPMVAEAAEVRIRSCEDLRFGPLISFALGGIHMEAVSEQAYRVSPLTDLDARHMIGELRGSRLLDGYRGHPAADREALEEALLRLSRLVEAVPQIARVDLDPVLALTPGEGYRIAEARIALAPPAGKTSAE